MIKEIDLEIVTLKRGLEYLDGENVLLAMTDPDEYDSGLNYKVRSLRARYCDVATLDCMIDAVKSLRVETAGNR